VTSNGMSRHFLDLTQFEGDELRHILDACKRIKKTRNGVRRGEGILAGKVLAMIFEQPSTRTRISFDVGMRELGGETLMLTGAEMQLGRGETIADTARVCRVSSTRS
jgi:ornithine carbamoyltransferase